MDRAATYLAFAETIDAARAGMLRSDFGAGPGRTLGVLLATAFPPLLAQRDHQLAALAALEEQGFRVERRRSDVLRDARARLRAFPEPEAALSELRRFVWAERARIALRELLPLELGGAPIQVTARELGWLADAALEIALDEARSNVASRFGDPRRANGEPSRVVAFGMGKLGGQELNAGSDVDLVFVYDTDDGGSALSLHEHWSRVVRRAVASIEAPTEDGLIWRVDLRLRPEGSGGPIANSVAATERYYETWGRLWERAALLRARPAAGDLELGALIEREIFTPFVYRHRVDPAIASTLAELVERSRSELSPDPTRDLKLGPGGIREAEFFVQILQLVWGGREPSLRVQNTLAAVARLRSRGLMSDREAERVTRGYTLLRHVEHRVQWMQGVQTHLLPADPAELGRLARSLGRADGPALLADLDRARWEIGELFRSVIPGRRPARRSTRFDALLSAFDASEPVTTEAEIAFGSAEVAEHLAALARRPDGLLGDLTRERYPDFAAALLDALASCPDPEHAARTLRSIFGRFTTPGAYVSALAEDERALQRLMTVLGSSNFVGEALIARPELLDVVLFGGGAVSDPAAAVDLELDAQRDALDHPSDAYEEQQAFVTGLCVARRRVLVEVAVADLAGGIGTREATRLLSDLADQVLQHATARALEGTRGGLSVIALGKLGGRDIGYGSDLDVIFVFDPAAAPSADEATSHFARVAQRIIRSISEPTAAGQGYELDTRLRPSGAQGMLVTSLPAFARYHGIPLELEPDPRSSPTSSGAAWERQVLLRARVCAGDGELGRRVVEVAEAAAYEGGAPPVEEMHRLRLRMELELGRERPERRDLKTGRGGLLDIEFCTQWLQMRHGADRRVRTTDTWQALEVLHATGRLERGTFDVLRDGYRFLRRLEQRLHVVSGTSSSVLDTRSRGLTLLARRMGLQDDAGTPARQKLLAKYAEITESVRGAYLSALGLDSEPGPLSS